MAPAVKQAVDDEVRWRQRFINEQGKLIDELMRQRRELRSTVRTWEIAFLTLCAQFFVVCVAAVWGWAR